MLEKELDQLARLLKDDPHQQERLTELQTLIKAKLLELQGTIELRREQGLIPALQVVNTDEGKQLMGQIRVIFKQIEADQQALLEQRSIYEEQSSRYVTYFTVSSIALQILLITGITFRLNQEGEELRRSRTELLQSEERYRSLVTATAQAVWLANTGGELVSITSTWQSITGQTEEELKGWGWLATVHPQDRDTARQAWQEAVMHRSLYQAEYRLQSPEKEYRDFLVRGVPVLEADNSVREWVGTYVDITERKRSAQALEEVRNALEVRVQERTRELAKINRELQAEIMERKQIERQLEQFAASLQHSNQELEQFAYVASHDLQEPLRTVASYTQLLAKKYQGELDEKADKYIGYVVDGATRMQQLINDLLTYSRVGKQTLNLTPVDCNSILEQVCALLETAISETKTTITIASLPIVVADASHLAKLFQNLISNAIKYHSDAPLEINITAVHHHNKWVFSVKDNGIGIDPQYAERIFVIFQRLHTRREYSGTGIGLAICKKIVELHQGRIWVESQLGQGSTFFFVLPHLDQTQMVSHLEVST